MRTVEHGVLDTRGKQEAKWVSVKIVAIRITLGGTRSRMHGVAELYISAWIVIIARARTLLALMRPVPR